MDIYNSKIAKFVRWLNRNLRPPESLLVDPNQRTPLRTTGTWVSEGNL